jgi:hypothetical protein
VVTGSEGPPVAPNAAASVRDIGSADAGRGWVLTSDRLALTTDGGASWVTVTPPGVDTSQILGIGSAGEQMWVGVRGGSDRAPVVEVLVSDDAGASWAAAGTIPVDVEPATVHFTGTGRRTLALVQLVSGSAFDRGVLYAAPTGGGAWRLLGGLPASGAVAFVDDRLGVVTGGAARDTVLVTRDGGSTWDAPALGADDGARVLGAVATGGTLVVATAHASDEAADVSVFSSSDGRSWASSGRARVPGSPDGLVFDAVSPETWFVGGATLFRHDPTGVTQRAGAGLVGTLTLFHFTNAESGWALATISGCRGFKTDCFNRSEVLATDDGGGSWRRLAP